MFELNSDPENSGISNSEEVLNEIDAFLSFKTAGNSSRSSNIKKISGDPSQENVCQKIINVPPKDPPIQVEKYTNHNDLPMQQKSDENVNVQKEDDESLSQIEKLDFRFSDSDIADLSFGDDDDQTPEKPKLSIVNSRESTPQEISNSQSPTIKNELQNDDNNSIKDVKSASHIPVVNQETINDEPNENQQSIDEKDIFTLSKLSDLDNNLKDQSVNLENNLKIANEKAPIQKKSTKSRRRPIQNHDMKTPLQLLDDLDIPSVEEENNQKTNLNDDFLAQIADDSKEIGHSMKDESNTQPQEKDPIIPQNELIEKESIPSNSNSQLIRSSRPTTPLEVFESSFVSYLTDMLFDLGLSFKNTFKDYVSKCFNLDLIIDPVINETKKELSEIINNEVYKLNESPFGEIQSELNMDFDSFSFDTLPKKKENEYSLFFDNLSLINDMQYFQSKYANEFRNIFSQMSNEYKNFNTLVDRIFSNVNYSENSIITQKYDLEAKDVQISLEKNHLYSRLSCIQRLRTELSDINMFKQKTSSSPESEIMMKELEEIIEFLHNHKYKGEVVEKVDEMKLIHEEILKLNSQIIAKTKSISNMVPDLAQTSSNQNEIIVEQYQPTFSFPQNDMLNDIRARLMRAKKNREEAIAEVQKLDQFEFFNPTV